jgi:hypothetical protein
MDLSRVVARPRLRLFALLVPVSIALGALAFGTPEAGATTGHAGPIAVAVTPDARLVDGQSLHITADAPSGVVIYEIRAHLCLAGPNVRSNFDFGFQGQRCSNVAVGHGDFEQSVSYPSGVSSGSLNTFKVGVGTARWVDELGYPGTISCGPGHPCDVIVRIQITDATVFFDEPLCFDASCPSDSGGGGATTTTVAVSSPTSSAGSGTTSTTVGSVGANHARSGGPKPTGTNASTGTKGSQAATGGNGTADGGANRSASAATANRAANEPTIHDGDSSAHLLIATLAGAVAGGWIVSIVMRGEGWVAFAIAKRRRRRPGLRAT